MKLPMVSTYHPGLYTIRMLKDDASYGMGNLFYLKPGTQCIVFDCDGTLTTGDQEVVTQFICTATYDPERFNAAATMVRFWAAKGYQIVYLSGRQGTMYNWTMSWLIRHGFPPGPIHLTRTSLPTLPTYSSVGKFKCDYMKGLVDKGLEIYAAYGNTGTDIKAYEEVGIPQERTWIMGPHGGDSGSQNIEEWSQSGYHYHMAEISQEPDATVCTPYLSLDWGAPFWGFDI
jgi:phosphatidate phosphatase PAH1